MSGRVRIWRRIVSATQSQSQSQGRANSADFGQEFDLSQKDIKSFYINDLVWLGRQDSNLGSRDQSPLPYRLATPQSVANRASPDQSDRPPATLSHMGWAGLSYQYHQGSAMHRFRLDDSRDASAATSADGAAAVADGRDGGIESIVKPPQALLPQD